MNDYKKRELEAEMAYKKQLLDIENDKVVEYMEKVKNYFETKFKTESESWIDRRAFFDSVSILKRSIDDSRATMEEIHDLRVDLGIEYDEI